MPHWLWILVFGASVHHGNCMMKCYTCSSRDNEACLKPTPQTVPMNNCNLKELASTQKYAKGIDSVFEKIFEVDMAPLGSVPMNCLKQVTKVGDLEVIIRGCQLAPTEQLDICVKVREASKDTVRTKHCSLCNSDGCNSGPSLITTPTTILTLIGTLLLNCN